MLAKPVEKQKNVFLKKWSITKTRVKYIVKIDR